MDQIKPDQPEGVDSIVLEEEIDPNYVPSEGEVIEYAKWLGMDLEADKDLFWIAREGLMAPLPSNWKPCKTKDTEDIYYFNFSSGESTWDHPCDGYYKRLYEEEKKKKEITIKESNDEKRHKAKQDMEQLLGKKEKKKNKTRVDPVAISEPKADLAPVLDRKPLPNLRGSSLNSLDSKSDLLIGSTLDRQPKRGTLSDSGVDSIPNSPAPSKSFVDNSRSEKPELKDAKLVDSLPTSSLSKLPLKMPLPLFPNPLNKGNALPDPLDRKDASDKKISKINSLDEKTDEKQEAKYESVLTPFNQDSPKPSSVKVLNNESIDHVNNDIAMNQLKEAIVKLEQENNKLTYRIAFQEMEIKNSKSELDSMSGFMEKLRVTNEELQKCKFDLMSKSEELNSINSKLQIVELEKIDQENLSKKFIELQRDHLTLQSNFQQNKRDLELETLKIKSIEEQNQKFFLSLKQKEEEYQSLLLNKKNIEQELDSLKSKSYQPSEVISNNLSENVEKEISNYKSEIEKLTKKLKSQISENSNLQDSLALKDANLREFKTILDTLKQDNLDSLASKAGEIESLKNSIKDLQQFKLSLERENEQLKIELSKSEITKTAITNNLFENKSSSIVTEDLRGDLAKVREENLRILNENANYKNKVQSLEFELLQAQQETKSKDSKLQYLISKQSEIESISMNSDQTISQFRHSLQEKDQEINALKSRLHQFEIEILKYQEITKLKDSLNSIINQKDQDLDNIKSKLQQYEIEISSLQKTLQDRDDSLLQHKRKNEEISSNLSKFKLIETEKKNLEDLLGFKDQEIKQIKSDLDHLYNNKGFAENVSQLSTTSIEYLSNQLNCEKENVVKLQHEILHLKNELQSKIMELEIEKNKVSSFQLELVPLRENIVSKEKDINMLQSELTKYNLKLDQEKESSLQKDKKIKSFREELLQVQKRMTEKEMAKLPSFTMSTQTDKIYSLDKSLQACCETVERGMITTPSCNTYDKSIQCTPISSSSSYSTSCQTDFIEPKQAEKENIILEQTPKQPLQYSEDIQQIKEELLQRKNECNILFNLLQNSVNTVKENDKPIKGEDKEKTLQLATSPISSYTNHYKEKLSKNSEPAVASLLENRESPQEIQTKLASDRRKHSNSGSGRQTFKSPKIKFRSLKHEIRNKKQEKASKFARNYNQDNDEISFDSCSEDESVNIDSPMLYSETYNNYKKFQTPTDYDDLGSISEIYVKSPSDESNMSLNEKILSNMSILISNLSRKICEFKIYNISFLRQLNSLTSSTKSETSSSSLLWKGIDSLYQIIQDKIDKEIDLIHQFFEVSQSIKPFIQLARNQIKDLKQSYKQADNQNDSKHSSRDSINNLTNDLNILIRLTRNIDSFIEQRKLNLEKLKEKYQDVRTITKKYPSKTYLSQLSIKNLQNLYASWNNLVRDCQILCQDMESHLKDFYNESHQFLQFNTSSNSVNFDVDLNKENELNQIYQPLAEGFSAKQNKSENFNQIEAKHQSNFSKESFTKSIEPVLTDEVKLQSRKLLMNLESYSKGNPLNQISSSAPQSKISSNELNFKLDSIQKHLSSVQLQQRENLKQYDNHVSWLGNLVKEMDQLPFQGNNQIGQHKVSSKLDSLLAQTNPRYEIDRYNFDEIPDSLVNNHYHV